MFSVINAQNLKMFSAINAQNLTIHYSYIAQNLILLSVQIEKTDIFFSVGTVKIGKKGAYIPFPCLIPGGNLSGHTIYHGERQPAVPPSSGFTHNRKQGALWREGTANPFKRRDETITRTQHTTTLQSPNNQPILKKIAKSTYQIRE